MRDSEEPETTAIDAAHDMTSAEVRDFEVPAHNGTYALPEDRTYYTAASLLVAAGDNPDRLHSERSRAHLCGVCPIPTG
jgi:hypothetical protein